MQTAQQVLQPLLVARWAGNQVRATHFITHLWTWEGHERNRQAEGVLERDASVAREKTLGKATSAAYVALCLCLRHRHDTAWYSSSR